MIEDINVDPNGYPPKVFQVLIGIAIGACGSCGFGSVYCCFSHVGGENSGERELGQRSYSPVCPHYFSVFGVVWKS